MLLVFVLEVSMFDKLKGRVVKLKDEILPFIPTKKQYIFSIFSFGLFGFVFYALFSLVA